jgi:hypothetical protein
MQQEQQQRQWVEEQEERIAMMIDSDATQQREAATDVTLRVIPTWPRETDRAPHPPTHISKDIADAPLLAATRDERYNLATCRRSHLLRSVPDDGEGGGGVGLMSHVPQRKMDFYNKILYNPLAGNTDPTYSVKGAPQQIGCVKLRLLSPNDVTNMSVTEVSNTNYKGTGSLSDLRMGPTSNSAGHVRCLTCGGSYAECPGHIGYFKMRPVVNHVFGAYVARILNCICLKCNRLCVHPAYVRLVMRYNTQVTTATHQHIPANDDAAGNARIQHLKALNKLSDRVSRCAQCMAVRVLRFRNSTGELRVSTIPGRMRLLNSMRKAQASRPTSVRPTEESGEADIDLADEDSAEHGPYSDHDIDTGPLDASGQPPPPHTTATASGPSALPVQQGGDATLVSGTTVLYYLMHIPYSDLEVMGIDPVYNHPISSVITYYPIIPHCSCIDIRYQSFNGHVPSRGSRVGTIIGCVTLDTIICFLLLFAWGACGGYLPC